MRIASLLPATTEWVAAFGAVDDLVARSHECHDPPSVADVPVVTRTTVPGGLDSQAIDDAVQATIQAGLSLFDVDLDALRASRPDVILTQTQCDVCAVPASALDGALEDWTGQVGGAMPEVVSLAPMTFKEVLESGLRIGHAIGRTAEAMAFLAEHERHLHALRTRLGLARDDSFLDGTRRPTVACVEWLAPLMTAGHWTPDLVAHAGGVAVGAARGAASGVVTWDDLRALDPDVLAVMPCGFALDQTRRDLGLLTEQPGWDDLGAVRTGRVVLLDGDAYFNRPGPRLYRSIELLTAALHPERAAVETAPWELARLGELAHAT
ncbi:MAG: ABC transporter substrate-binding protein [Bacteroidota bacterium]